MTTLSEFMQSPKNMLVYLSTPGLGKTYFCAALADWALSTFNTVRYHKEEKLLSSLRDGISEGFGDYTKNLHLAIDDELVILDDIASGINPHKASYKDLEWRREIMYAFLDYRYNSMLPTIITSNFTSEEVKEVFSERIHSRMFARENKFIQIFDAGTDKRMAGM